MVLITHQHFDEFDFVENVPYPHQAFSNCSSRKPPGKQKKIKANDKCYFCIEIKLLQKIKHLFVASKGSIFYNIFNSQTYQVGLLAYETPF